MDRIIEHMERLLLWHDCVIIPDFGGFVLQSVSAIYIEEEHAFTPARKEIVFNPVLVHNDGLLTESYMQKYAVDFTKALQWVWDDVAWMREMLDDNTEFQFGRIGIFIKEKDQIFFLPDKESNILFSISSYGLPVFHCLSLALRTSAAELASNPVAKDAGSGARKTENPPKSSGIIFTIPVSRAFVHFLGLVAASVIFFLLISIPVKEIDRASYSANFVPQEMIPKKTVDEIVSDAFSAMGTLESAVNPLASDGYVALASVGSVVKTPVTELPAFGGAVAKMFGPAPAKSSTGKESVSVLPAIVVSENVSGNYYVIIGSFDTRRRAKAYINRLKGEMATDVGILERDGKIRVYARQFSSRESAHSYLDKIRQNTEYKQAWLYEKP
jgi:hypothetical protein